MSPRELLAIEVETTFVDAADEGAKIVSQQRDHRPPARVRSIELMDSELTYAWVIGLASAPLLEVAKSAAQYPHIPPGADFKGYE